MPTIHDEAAYAALQQLAKVKPSELRNELTKLFPGWENNAIVDSLGYARLTNTHQHVSIRTARMLHDVLPEPFNHKAFDWTRSHGFDRVLDFLEWPERKDKEVERFIADAIERCRCVMETG